MLTMMSILCAGLVSAWSVVLASFAGSLRALWREPVFRAPIAILESDDWGAGPASQAAALSLLGHLLTGLRNARGELPVMTVGVVLETIDRDASREQRRYVAATLSDERHAAVLAALRSGERAGVFALQLHGRAHYWPDVLMNSASRDPLVAAWIGEPGIGWTETLPSPVQSRWTDASTLPSQRLPLEHLEAAARDEVAAWCRVFDVAPAVAVPTTFVWNAAVERALAESGVRVLVTPGTRHEGRDAAGLPTSSGITIRNGQRGAGGIMFVVRDAYFEPALGHHASRLADEVLARANVGRPALIEMHRFNFCGPRAADTAFEDLREALVLLLQRVPSVRFLSTEALADAISRGDGAWLELNMRRRVAIWGRRALAFRPFARWARMTGLAWPLSLLGSMT